MSRIYTQQELQAFTDAENELAVAGLIVGDKFNSEVIIGWFDQNPTVPATKENIIKFVEHPNVKPKLHWKSSAQMKFEQVAQDFTPQQQKTVMDWLRSRRLVFAPGADETFTNAAEILSAMRGRDFTISNLDYCMNYCLGHGTTLYRSEAPRQNPSQDRGHKAVSSEDYRWAPKETTNTPGPGLVSHSSNPRFNGQNEREKRERMDKHLPGSSDAAVARMNAMWLAQAQALRGNIHSETQRIQAVVAQTPGDGHAAYKAGVAEQKRIERERSGAR